MKHMYPVREVAVLGRVVPITPGRIRAVVHDHQLPPGYGQGRVLLPSVNTNDDLKQNYTYSCKLCGRDKKCKCVMVEGHNGCESARQGRMG